MSSVVIIATITAHEGKRDAVRQACLDMLAPARAEEGNHQYHLQTRKDNPDVFVFYEVWADQEAFDFHVATEHLQGFLAFLEDTAELDIAQLEPLEA